MDVDGHCLDANVGDMSTFCGYAPPAVTEAIAARATRGVQFMLPVEDSMGGRGNGTKVRAAALAVHPFGHHGQHRGDPAGPLRHRA